MGPETGGAGQSAGIASGPRRRLSDRSAGGSAADLNGGKGGNGSPGSPGRPGSGGNGGNGGSPGSVNGGNASPPVRIRLMLAAMLAAMSGNPGRPGNGGN